MNVIIFLSIIFSILISKGSTGTPDATDEARISLTDVKKLLQQMLQIAALRKESEAGELLSNPCPPTLQQRNGCSAFLSILSAPVTHDNRQRLSNAFMPTSLESVPEDSIGSDSELSTDEATGIADAPSLDRNAGDTNHLQGQHIRRLGVSSSGRQQQQEQGSLPMRSSRIFPRFMGKTVLNRAIRMGMSRGSNSGKRALDCIRKCIVEGGLHPVQCHSIC